MNDITGISKVLFDNKYNIFVIYLKIYFVNATMCVIYGRGLGPLWKKKKKKVRILTLKSEF